MRDSWKNFMEIPWTWCLQAENIEDCGWEQEKVTYIFCSSEWERYQKVCYLFCWLNQRDMHSCIYGKHTVLNYSPSNHPQYTPHTHTTKCSSVNSSMLCTWVTCFRTFCKTTKMSLSALLGLRGTWWPSTLAVAQKQDGVKDLPNALHFINISFHTSLPSQESQVNWCSEERMRERFNSREMLPKHLHLL